jgi:hypothetical protein
MLTFTGEPEQYEPILSKGNTVVGMAYDFQKESPVPPRVLQRIRWQSPNREPAQDKRPGSERNILIVIVTAAPDDLDLLCLLDHPNGNRWIEEGVLKEFPSTCPRMFQHRDAPAKFVAVTTRWFARPDKCLDHAQAKSCSECWAITVLETGTSLSLFSCTSTEGISTVSRC